MSPIGSDGLPNAVSWEKSRCSTKDNRLREDVLIKNLKGKNGATLVAFVQTVFPELRDVVTSKTNQTQIRGLVAQLRGRARFM
jgi:hypothetical protein